SFNTSIERAHCKPWGLSGGMEADGNSVGVRVDGVWEDNLPNAKLAHRRLKKGDAFSLRSGGGGGYGDPRQRPREKVAHDLAEGYVSPQAAERDYGFTTD